jgi:hypothetical protein
MKIKKILTMAPDSGKKRVAPRSFTLRIKSFFLPLSRILEFGNSDFCVPKNSAFGYLFFC